MISSYSILTKMRTRALILSTLFKKIHFLWLRTGKGTRGQDGCLGLLGTRLLEGSVRDWTSWSPSWAGKPSHSNDKLGSFLFMIKSVLAYTRTPSDYHPPGSRIHFDSADLEIPHSSSLCLKIQKKISLFSKCAPSPLHPPSVLAYTMIVNKNRSQRQKVSLQQKHPWNVELWMRELTLFMSSSNSKLQHL